MFRVTVIRLFIITEATFLMVLRTSIRHCVS